MTAESFAAPAGVSAYLTTIDFLAEYPWASSRWEIKGDLGGYDAITRVKDANGSEWRISVIHGLVYAVLRRYSGSSRYTFDGPVWVLAQLPEGYQRLDLSLESGTRAFFFDLELRCRRGSATLLDVVAEVRTWAAGLTPIAESLSSDTLTG